jgi:hypothetical protein
LYERGLMYASGPNPKPGRALLEEAVEIFRRLGARPYYDLAREAIEGPN